jgi:hypothetical protein
LILVGCVAINDSKKIEVFTADAGFNLSYDALRGSTNKFVVPVVREYEKVMDAYGLRYNTNNNSWIWYKASSATTNDFKRAADLSDLMDGFVKKGIK